MKYNNNEREGKILDIRAKLLSMKFMNNSYFTDLREYISERVEQEKLDYNKLKYIYDNLYNGYSEFIRQNIFPVGEFLAEGYSIEECEKIANLLEDATGKTVFCHEKSEQNYKFNKLFIDLRFCFNAYSKFFKENNNKDIAFENVKEELESTPLPLRKIIIELESENFFYGSEIESNIEYLKKEMGRLQKSFEESTSNDDNLKRQFKDDDRYKNIRIAKIILAGIDLRNIQRENNNVDGQLEEYPYSNEQLKIIDTYQKYENVFEKINQLWNEKNNELEWEG